MKDKEHISSIGDTVSSQSAVNRISPQGLNFATGGLSPELLEALRAQRLHLNVTAEGCGPAASMSELAKRAVDPDTTSS